MITARWELEPDAKVWIRMGTTGVFASRVESDRHGTHDWPTAIHQPRAIMLYVDPNASDNRVVALVFETGVDKW